MKKVLFLTALAAIMTSCIRPGVQSNRKATGSVSFGVDNVPKTFNVLLYDDNNYYDYYGEKQIRISVFSKYNEINDYISFSFTKGKMNDDLSDFTYIKPDGPYYTISNNFSVNITSNGNDKRLIATFAGDIISSVDTLTITNGSVDVKY